MKTVKKTWLVATVASLCLVGMTARSAGPARDLVTYPLIAGQVYNAGTVSVWHDDDTLYIKFQTTGGWTLNATYVAVAATLSGIPQNKNGSPLTGQFPYQDTQLPSGTTTKTYTINLNVLNLDHMVIATHANVTLIGTQTAWAGDLNFPSANWAKYFKYDIIPAWWPEE